MAHGLSIAGNARGLEADAAETGLLGDVGRRDATQGVAGDEDVLGAITLLGRRLDHLVGEVQRLPLGAGDLLAEDLQIAQQATGGGERIDQQILASGGAGIGDEHLVLGGDPGMGRGAVERVVQRQLMAIDQERPHAVGRATQYVLADGAVEEFADGGGAGRVGLRQRRGRGALQRVQVGEVAEADDVAVVEQAIAGPEGGFLGHDGTFVIVVRWT